MATIRYNPAGVFLQEGGISAERARGAGAAARRRPGRGAGRRPAVGRRRGAAEEKIPLDAGFHLLPNRLLADLKNNKANSEVARLNATADRLASQCASVVVLGIGGSYMGARALLEACCHPYYNEVAPTQRNGRPRIYFEGNNVDNDALQGLFDVLRDQLAGVGRRGDQQERRHARNGRRASDSAARTAGFARRRRQAGRTTSCRSPARAASCSTWQPRWAATKCSRCPTASAGGSRSSRRSACCRRRSWGSTS